MSWIRSRSSASRLRRAEAGATHENLSRDPVSVGTSDRRFGLVFTGFWLLVGLWPLRYLRKEDQDPGQKRDYRSAFELD